LKREARQETDPAGLHHIAGNPKLDTQPLKFTDPYLPATEVPPTGSYPVLAPYGATDWLAVTASKPASA
jgi:hypothetical protein